MKLYNNYKNSFTLMASSVILLCLITSVLYPLTPTRVILATDNNPLYIDFWPIIAKAWKKRIGVEPTLALIADKAVSVDESLGTVIRFKPIQGIPTSFYAQCIRLLLPVLFEHDVCILSDMDMLPISKAFFCDSIQKIPDNYCVVYNNRAYKNKKPQYPICYVAAKGGIFRELFSISTYHEIPSKIRDLYSLKAGWTTDELVLYSTLRQWGVKTKRVFLRDLEAGKQRIDRGRWGYNRELLKNGYYIDAHLLRPYKRYWYDLMPLLVDLDL